MFQNIISGLLFCVMFLILNLISFFDSIKLKADEKIRCFVKKISGFITTYDLHRASQNIGNLNH